MSAENVSHPATPAEIDPKQFFVTRGKRPMFSPYKLAMFINQTYGPIIYQDKRFIPIPAPRLVSIMALILKDHFSMSSSSETLACLSALTYRDPELYIPYRGGLSPLDVQKYLLHYGIAFHVKPSGDNTLYILDQCLFNPEHGDLAAIIQSASGYLSYLCAHQDCGGAKWTGVREKISGDKPLTQFCMGNDTDYISDLNHYHSQRVAELSKSHSEDAPESESAPGRQDQDQTPPPQ